MKNFTLKEHHEALTEFPSCENPGNWDMKKLAIPGTRIRSADWNAEFINVIDHSNPASISPTADDTESFRAIIDPFPEVPPDPPNIRLPDSLCVEIRELKYQLNAVIGEDYWYNVPAATIKQLEAQIGVEGVTGANLHNHKGLLADPDYGGGALIETEALADNAVATLKIVDLAVTTEKINALAVTTEKINALAVTTEKINDLAVTTEKVNDGAITLAKLSPTLSLGKTQQIVASTVTTPVLTRSEVMPSFDPLVTDGYQVYSTVITPKAVGNILVMEAIFPWELDNASGFAQKLRGAFFIGTDSASNVGVLASLGAATTRIGWYGIIRQIWVVPDPSYLTALTIQLRLGQSIATGLCTWDFIPSAAVDDEQYATITITEYNPA
jgi:hypothetical protein